LNWWKEGEREREGDRWNDGSFINLPMRIPTELPINTDSPCQDTPLTMLMHGELLEQGHPVQEGQRRQHPTSQTGPLEGPLL